MFIIISGCSGVGKNTVINQLLNRNKNLKLLKTCTSRNPRIGEDPVNGNYIFLSRAEFEKKIKKGELFEYEEIHKNFYGMLKKSLEEVSDGKNDYIKDIGVLGQINLKRELEGKTKVLSIFLTAPRDLLIERLKKRGEADIDLRLSRMEFEMSYKNNYNAIIENVNLEKVIKKIEYLIYKMKNEK